MPSMIPSMPSPMLRRPNTAPRTMSPPIRAPQLLPVMDIPAAKGLAAMKRGALSSSKTSRKHCTTAWEQP